MKNFGITPVGAKFQATPTFWGEREYLGLFPSREAARLACLEWLAAKLQRHSNDLLDEAKQLKECIKSA